MKEQYNVLFLHRQFGALDHRRSDPQSRGPRPFQGL